MRKHNEFEIKNPFIDPSLSIKANPVERISNPQNLRKQFTMKLVQTAQMFQNDLNGFGDIWGDRHLQETMNQKIQYGQETQTGVAKENGHRWRFIQSEFLAEFLMECDMLFIPEKR